MTRDEHRDKCIEAMARAACLQEHIERFGENDWRPGELDQKVDQYWPHWIAKETAAFDSLHGIARVVPPEATEEMIYIGELVKADGGDVAKIFASMAKVGNLTNPPEKKPCCAG